MPGSQTVLLFPASGSRGWGSVRALQTPLLSAEAQLQRISGVVTQIWVFNSSGTPPLVVSLHLGTL